MNLIVNNTKHFIIISKKKKLQDGIKFKTKKKSIKTLLTQLNKYIQY